MSSNKCNLQVTMNDVLSTNYIIRRNALKSLQTIELPNTDPKDIVQLFCEEKDTSTTAAKSKRLDWLLLQSVQDDSSPEICREKATICLQICIQKLHEFVRVLGDDDRRRQQKDENEDDWSCIKLWPFLTELYIEFCSIFHSRFSTMQSNNMTGGRNGSANRTPPAEEAEEIRLVLVQIMREILQLMQQTMKQQQQEQQQKEHSNKNTTPTPSTMCPSTYAPSMVQATSLLCTSLAKSAIPDKYPELKRESCFLLSSVTRLFPNVVQLHGEALLYPITGGCSGNSSYSSSSIGRADDDYGFGPSSSPSSSFWTTSKDCLLRHRHAKTRSLGLDVIVDILSTYRTKKKKGSSNGESTTRTSEEDDDDGDDGKETTLEDLLKSHVLLSLESFSVYDRVVNVRKSLSKAVGELLRLQIIKRSSSDSDKVHSNTNKKNSTSSCMIIGRLLILLLMGLSDEAKVVRDISQIEFDSIEQLWLERQKSMSVPEASSRRLLPNFTKDIVTIFLRNRSNHSSLQEKTRSLDAFSITIKILNSNSSSCFTQKKGSNILLLGGSDPTTTIHQIIQLLCDSLADPNEKMLCQAGINCSTVLGQNSYLRHLATKTILRALDGDKESLESSSSMLEFGHHIENNDGQQPQMSSTSKSLLCSTSQHLASLLYVLGGHIRGAAEKQKEVEHTIDKRATVYHEVKEISRSLVSRKVIEYVHTSHEAAAALLNICHALVSFLSTNVIENDKSVHPQNHDPKQDDDDERSEAVSNISYCCIHLLACPDQFDFQDSATMLLESLATTSLPGLDSTPRQLLELYFQDIYKLLTRSLLQTEKGIDKSWHADEPDLKAFDAFVRYNSTAGISDNFESIASILDIHLSSNNKSTSDDDKDSSTYTRKLFVMALMESIVSNPSLPQETMQLFNAELIQSSIIPNLVWRVGGMAAALRKLSAAVLFSIIQNDGLTEHCLFLVAPHLLPVLKSSLSDDDASTRELTTASLGRIFENIPGSLGEEAVHQLYPDLMKGMDDSSDSVRFASCGALKYFLKAAEPIHFHGTAIEYMVENLCVHLDDPDDRIQGMVLDVLTIALEVDYATVLKCVESAVFSHKSKKYCNILKERASEKISLQKIMKL